MKNTMPDKNDLKALAKWYNETALDLVEDVLTKHTATLLGALKEQVQKPTTARDRMVWRAAMTLANNLCVQNSDRHNNDDETAESKAAADCAADICRWLEPDDGQLAELLMEAGVA